MKGESKMKSKSLIISVVVALAGFLPQSKADLILGTADSFAVLAHSTVTSSDNTVLNGNLGLYPGTSITGFYPPGVVNGTTYAGGSVAAQAQTDALTAYNFLAGEKTGAQNLSGEDLGTLILTPGVYKFDSSAGLGVTGTLTTLTLSGSGNFVFQIGSTLTTASGSSMVLTGGARAANVYWQVGSSATLGTGTAFDGSILAHDSITLDTGADLSGRALALTGAVTLYSNDISVPTAVPEPGTLISGALLLLPFGASTLRILRRRQAA
jgi:type VI secretion system secreted protein VgrG